jgi:hypothetical protein
VFAVLGGSTPETSGQGRLKRAFDGKTVAELLIELRDK